MLRYLLCFPPPPALILLLTILPGCNGCPGLMTQQPCGINDPAMKGREDTLNAVGNPREAGKDIKCQILHVLTEQHLNVLKRPKLFLQEILIRLLIS